MKQICLDTGIFSMFFEDNSRDQPRVVQLLGIYNDIREKMAVRKKLKAWLSNQSYPKCIIIYVC